MKRSTKDKIFAIAVIVMVITGTVRGLFYARLYGKNSIVTQFSIEVELKEDLICEDYNDHLNRLINFVLGEGDPEYPMPSQTVTVPKGSIGKIDRTIRYYNPDKTDSGKITGSKVVFTLSDGSKVGLMISETPEGENPEEGIISINTLTEDPDVKSKYGKAFDDFHAKWTGHLIMGAAMGFGVFAVIGLILGLIYRFVANDKVRTALIIIAVVIILISAVKIYYAVWAFDRLH